MVTYQNIEIKVELLRAKFTLKSVEWYKCGLALMS